MVGVGAYRPEDHYMGCWVPPLKGELHFSFNVNPDKSLVTPTSVAVTVNDVQADLLRDQVEHLKDRASSIREQLKAAGPQEAQALVKRSLDQAIKDLDETEEMYKKKGSEPSFIPAINIYFGDIRRTYIDALKSLPEAPRAARTSGQLKKASLNLDRSPSDSEIASVLDLTSIDHNVAAYNTALTLNHLTFNLDVWTDPMGATISYKRAGEEFQKWDRTTNSKILNLPIAAYTIRLQLSGFQDAEVPFDAAKDTTSNINLKLTPRGGARCA